MSLVEQYLKTTPLGMKDTPPRIRKFATYRFVEFIRPGGYWPSPYSLEQAFGVFRWMVESADKLMPDPRRYGRSALEPLFSKSSAYPADNIRPITSITDLKERFQYALFGILNVGYGAEAWRKHERVTVDGKRQLYFPHYEPFNGPTCEGDFHKLLTGLFNAEGTLAVQLNQFHEKATAIYGVKVFLSKPPYGWSFAMEYGYPDDDRSTWQYTLASECRYPKASFWTLATIAANRLAELCTPGCPLPLDIPFRHVNCKCAPPPSTPGE